MVANRSTAVQERGTKRAPQRAGRRRRPVIAASLLANRTDWTTATVADVIEAQTTIQTHVAAKGKVGVAYFNEFYLGVTEGVQTDLERTEFGADADRFIKRLDINFYLRYQHALTSVDVPPAWQPLIDRDAEVGRIPPVLYGISGVTAHIFRDLPWAILLTLLEDGSPFREQGFPGPSTKLHSAFTNLNLKLYEESKVCLRRTFRASALGFAERIFPASVDCAVDLLIKTGRELAWTRAARLKACSDRERGNVAVPVWRQRIIDSLDGSATALMDTPLNDWKEELDTNAQFYSNMFFELGRLQPHLSLEMLAGLLRIP